MKKAILCGIVGGIVVFIWGMVSWKMLPWHVRSLHQFKNEAQVYEAIKKNAPVSGIYVLPNMYGASAAQESHQKMLAKGPVMFASVLVEGAGHLSVMPFVIALATQIVGAILIMWMLMQTKLNSFRKKVGFVVLVGFLVGLLGVLPAWNWWGFSGAYVLSCFGDLIIGWGLAGLAMVKLMKRVR